MKKYRSKETGEIVEAEQWHYVSSDGYSSCPLGSSMCHDFHLGVEPYIEDKDASLSICNVDKCGFKLNEHGWLRNASGRYRYVCPGDYIIINSNDGAFICPTCFFDRDYELFEEKPEVAQEDRFVVLFETTSGKGHLIKISDITMNKEGSSIAICVGHSEATQTFYRLYFDTIRDADVYWSTFRSFIESSCPAKFFFPEILKRAIYELDE